VAFALSVDKYSGLPDFNSLVSKLGATFTKRWLDGSLVKQKIIHHLVSGSVQTSLLNT
jgi:hypothetical protein